MMTMNWAAAMTPRASQRRLLRASAVEGDGGHDVPFCGDGAAVVGCGTKVTALACRAAVPPLSPRRCLRGAVRCRQLGPVGGAGERGEHVASRHGPRQPDHVVGGVGADRLHAGHVAEPGGHLTDAAAAAHAADEQAELTRRVHSRHSFGSDGPHGARRAVRALSKPDSAPPSGPGRSGQRPDRPRQGRRLNLKPSTTARDLRGRRQQKQAKEVFEMAASRFIEQESGTYTARFRHPHNGYYAGDFSQTPPVRSERRVSAALPGQVPPASAGRASRSGAVMRLRSRRPTPPKQSAVRALVAVSIAVLLAAPVLASAPASSAQAASHRPEPVAARVDRFLSAQLKDSAIPGAAVAVTHGDQVLMVRGYGHDSTGAAVTGDSLFRIASLSKSFTALAVMQLVDSGRLHLDDPVREHLPEFEMADPRVDQVTVRELLDHTSGITDAVVPDLSRDQPSSPREATTSLRSAHLASTPGTSYSYANPNYQVAARLVEVVSGEPFGRYLRRHILQPAQMSATTSTVTDDEPVPGLGEGHLIAYGHAFAAPGFGSYTVGDGGVVSTAADMARWLIVNANDGRAPDGTRLVSGRAYGAAPHPERSSRRLRPRMGDPRPERRPDPAWSTAAACSPSPPRRHSGRRRATGWCCCSTQGRR